ncbi:hypothetical protein FSARC_11124 [Fusarium sarcochroum]|uniref:Amidase domain-containing protein n=1 Tax=Fusarium sarcochroum TaxID=1208366 RepID=A0A8H4X0X0_9HYPO|nr:hypothetical protein FSARC_11124 [Fusarium sarcochroum]
MAHDLTYSDATQLAELIRTRKVSTVQVIQAHLDRINAVNPALNAIVSINPHALEAAKDADAAIASGKDLGPLHGVPFTVKDSIDTAGVPTQRGSPIFKDRIPETDAVSVARMKSAGGILLAKTNLPEFSYSTESDNLLTGRSNNPWNLDRTPGGSSGGESAAIAAGLSPLGLGTDLAISVRGPAAQTGIVSLKATHGRVPMTGIWPRAPRRFWHVGPMARSIRDLDLAYSILAGPDGHDAYSTIMNKEGPKIQGRKVRVGWMTGPGFGPIDPQVRSAVKAAAEALNKADCIVESVNIPALERDFALDVFMRIHVNDMKPDFEAATQGQPDDHIFKIARNMLKRSETSAKDFIKAEKAADRLKDAFAEYFDSFDILLCPVLPTPAHKHGASDLTIDGQTVNATYVMASTVPFNVTGLPAVSMRFGTSEDGLPIGVQLVAGWSNERMLLSVASRFESVSPVKDLHPKL